jgi:UPF0755 protein
MIFKKEIPQNLMVKIKNTDFSKINLKTLVKGTKIVLVLCLLFLIYSAIEIYIPLNMMSHESVVYLVKKGSGNSEIAKDLKDLGVIRSSYFFKIYVIASFNHTELKAGKYTVSSNMSIYQIAQKMAKGDVIKDRFVIYEGWTSNDIGEYLESRSVCSKEEFLAEIEKDFSGEYYFLSDKPDDLNLEGYLFPDTYEISQQQTCRNIVEAMLANFGKKLTVEIQEEINSQGKTIFDVVTMASLLEKEVKTIEDKKTVAGILWKRLEAGMPLQLDSTVNYITGKNDPGVLIKDTKIDSLYNTYKYQGLPKGPISNPGIDSITAVLYPTKSPYWYYLSDGKTIFSKTLEEHNIAKAKYLD